VARFITITNSNSSNLGKRKRAIRSEKKVGKITAIFVLVLMICASGVMYIFQVNKLATIGYEIKQREKTIDDLKKENEQLKVKAAELKSIYQLETKKEEMQMKKPDQVSFIEMETPVAMK